MDDLNSCITTRSGARLVATTAARTSVRKRRTEASSLVETSESTKGKVEKTEMETDLEDNPSSKALQNPLILSKILNYVPPKHFPELRRTCKLWNTAIIPLMRKNHVELNFSRGYCYNGCVCCSKGLKDRKHIGALQKFVNVMRKSASIPFGCYHVCDIPLNEPALDQLFQLCGKHMQKLKITFVAIVANYQVKITDMRKIIAKASPALRELKIKEFRCSEFWSKHLNSDNAKQSITFPLLKKFDVDFEADSKGSLFVQDIILAAPNLVTIDVWEGEMFDDDEWDDKIRLNSSYLQLLHALKTKPQLEKLEEISLSNMTADELEALEKLCMNGLKLKIFNAHRVHTSAVYFDGGRRLSMFLDTNSNNLESLSLSLMDKYDDPIQPIVIVVPKMNKLKALCMELYDNKDINVQFHSFMESFPNLKGLAYQHQDQYPQESKWQRHIISEPHFGIERLTVDYIGTPEKLDTLVTTFPSLQSLTIQLSGFAGFPSLWTNWPQLEKLTMSFIDINESQKLDTYITGVPDGAMEEWAKQNKFLVPYDELIAAKTEAGLIDLTCLRTFTLDLQWSSRNLEMSDNCGYYALAMAKNLQELSIYPAEHRRLPLSPECRDAIKESLGLHAVIRYRQEEEE